MRQEGPDITPSVIINIGTFNCNMPQIASVTDKSISTKGIRTTDSQCGCLRVQLFDLIGKFQLATVNCEHFILILIDMPVTPQAMLCPGAVGHRPFVTLQAMICHGAVSHRPFSPFKR